LALLNLLPIPRLDGGHLLVAFLDAAYPGTSVTHSVEDGYRDQEQLPTGKNGMLGDANDGPADSVRLKRLRLEQGVTWGTATLVVLSMGGMVFGMILDGLRTVG
jgi:membrane-associated protease RseP (regulator of RpoE activity)